MKETLSKGCDVVMLGVDESCRLVTVRLRFVLAGIRPSYVRIATRGRGNNRGIMFFNQIPKSTPFGYSFL